MRHVAVEGERHADGTDRTHHHLALTAEVEQAGPGGDDHGERTQEQRCGPDQRLAEAGRVAERRVPHGAEHFDGVGTLGDQEGGEDEQRGAEGEGPADDAGDRPDVETAPPAVVRRWRAGRGGRRIARP